MKIGTIKRIKINKNYPNLPQRTIYMVDLDTWIGRIVWWYLNIRDTIITKIKKVKS